MLECLFSKSKPWFAFNSKFASRCRRSRLWRAVLMPPDAQQWPPTCFAFTQQMTASVTVDSCKVSDVGRVLYLCSSSPSSPHWRQALEDHWNILQLASNSAGCLGTEDLIYCNLSKTVLLRALHLFENFFWKWVSTVPEAAGLRLIGECSRS